MIASSFSDVQVEALRSLASVLSGASWALIGASAIRCRLSLRRPTYDIDLAVGTTAAAVQSKLVDAGWSQHERTTHQWRRDGVSVDVVNATDEEIAYGVTHPEPGVSLTVVGFDLAYKNADHILLGPGLDVPVASLPAIVLLKMIAWQDRNDRDKDLEDIFYIWSEHLPADDDRRFNEPVRSAGLEHDDQGAFVNGWDLAMIADTAHQHYVARFLDKMRNEEGLAFARLVHASRVPGEESEHRVRLRLGAFEQGFVAGLAERERATHPIVERAPKITRGAVQRVTESELADRLHEAIDRRLVIRFHHGGKLRVAEAHVLGTKNGRVQLLVWQTAGASSSGPLPGWRRFYVRDISALELTGETFAGARVTRGVRHSAFDRHIAVVSR